MKTSATYFSNLIVGFLPSTRMFGFKRWLWRLCGVECASGVSINAYCRLLGPGSVAIGADSWVGIGCTFIVPRGASVQIGARCDIAPDVLFECGTHKIGEEAQRAGEGCSASISIGAGTWIGARVLLLGGAKIGRGSIVAAGSVVRAGNYPPNTLLGGVPARIIRKLPNEQNADTE